MYILKVCMSWQNFQMLQQKCLNLTLLNIQKQPSCSQTYPTESCGVISGTLQQHKNTVQSRGRRATPDSLIKKSQERLCCMLMCCMALGRYRHVTTVTWPLPVAPVIRPPFKYSWLWTAPSQPPASNRPNNFSKRILSLGNDAYALKMPLPVMHFHLSLSHDVVRANCAVAVMHLLPNRTFAQRKGLAPTGLYVAHHWRCSLNQNWVAEGR